MAPSVKNAQRTSFVENLKILAVNALRSRKLYKIIEVVEDEEVVMTPKILNVKYIRIPLEALTQVMPQFAKLAQEVDSIKSIKSVTSSVSRVKNNRGMGVRLSLDDIIAGVIFFISLILPLSDHSLYLSL